MDKRRLRLYERSKLRYYYAIICCDSAGGPRMPHRSARAAVYCQRLFAAQEGCREMQAWRRQGQFGMPLSPALLCPAATANKLYEECDGMEFMKSEHVCWPLLPARLPLCRCAVLRRSLSLRFLQLSAYQPRQLVCTQPVTLPALLATCVRPICSRLQV